MATRRSNRHQPYDMENPANWTVSKLITEIEKTGMKLTSNVSKSALLQIFNQLPAERLPTNEPSVTDNSESQKSTGGTSVNLVNESDSSVVMDSQTNINQVQTKSNDVSSIGLMAAMQQTITSLQCTVNKPIDEKQSSSAGQLESANSGMLQKVYQNSAQVQSNPSPSSQGIPADDLPHIDVVSDTIRRNITDGKYINLACLLLPKFDTPNLTTNDLSGLEPLCQSRRDHRLDKSLSITQFYQAFGIYKLDGGSPSVFRCTSTPMETGPIDACGET